jgi:hypothetical protein
MEFMEMNKFVADLKKMVSFKDTTDVGDIVLIAAQNPQTLVYASVVSIERDMSRKDEWWQVGLAMLTIPLQPVVVWTLRTPQMTGMEVFTMGGDERFVKAVDFGVAKKPPKDKNPLPGPPGLKRIK